MQVVVTFASAGLTALVVYLMVVGRPVVLPLVVAVFAAHLISALASHTRRVRVFGRPLGWTLRAGGALIVLLLLGWLVITLLINNSSQLMAAAPTYEGRVRLLLTNVSDWIGLEQPSFLEAPFGRGRLAALASGVALGLTGVIGSFGTVIIYTVFLLLEEHSIDRKIAALFADTERRAIAHRILHQIGAEVQTYVWLKTVLSMATTLASYAVMKWVGLDLAEFWALLIFWLNFIPYIGAWSGVIFPALLALLQFDAPGPIVVIAGALTVIQFTSGVLVEPRVIGTGLNLSPVVILLSLAIWGSIWGVIGMFLAVPMMVVLMIVCAHFDSTRPIAILMSADGQLPS